MKLSQLIKKLKILQKNQGDVDVLISEYAFTLGAVQCHVTELAESDVNYEPNLDQQPVHTNVTSGIVLGNITKYV